MPSAGSAIMLQKIRTVPLTNVPACAKPQDKACNAPGLRAFFVRTCCEVQIHLQADRKSDKSDGIAQT